MVEKKEMFEFENGEKKEITASSLKYKQRNKIFGEYLKMNEFMRAGDSSDIIKFIRDDKNPLDFIDAILEAGLDISTDNLESSDGDKLFQKFGAFILAGKGDVTKN